MKKLPYPFAFLLCMSAAQCADSETGLQEAPIQTVRTITYQGVSVPVVIDKPAGAEMDVVVALHGTVFEDSKVLDAAKRIGAELRRIVTRERVMIVSVAYPEENLLMGDNLVHAEAGLLWVQHRAAQELGIRIGRVFVVGHSQGGYLATRLNTLHETDGVVANAPGPLNLNLRCQLEADLAAPATPTCQLLQSAYGNVADNPAPYRERSLLEFTGRYRADALFIQGLDDGAVQLASWPEFKARVNDCNDCQTVAVFEVAGYGHEALFYSPQAQAAFNQFLNR